MVNSYIGGKYIPLKMVLFPSLAMFLAVIVLVMPVTLFAKGVPFQSWGPAFTSISLWGFTMVGFFSFMAWIFCELLASTISRIKSALLFGIVSPVAFIGILTLAAFFDGNNFLAGLDTEKGIKNMLILSGCSFLFGVIIYWQSTKST
jgi:hypothetical protein